MKEQHNSVNQYFQDVTQSLVLKDIFTTQGIPVHFNRWEYEMFIDKASDSALQIAFEKLLLVEYWYNIKNIWNYLKILNALLQLHIYLELDFFHVLHSEQYCKRLNAEADVKIKLQRDIKEFCKTKIFSFFKYSFY